MSIAISSTPPFAFRSDGEQRPRDDRGQLAFEHWDALWFRNCWMTQ